MKKCILFGVGTFFESNPDLFPSNFEIIGYGYSDPQLSTSVSRKLKNNKQIFSPHEIALMQNTNEICVCICSGPWSSYSIFNNLRENNVDVHSICFINETKAVNIPWQSRVDEKGNVITNVNGHDFIAILSHKYGGLKTSITNLDRYNSSFYDYLKFINVSRDDSKTLSEYLKESLKHIISEIENAQKNLDPQIIRIAIRTSAGLGDDLVMCRFIYALTKNIPNIEVDLYSLRPNNYKNHPFIKNSLNITDFNFIKSFEYDLVLDGTLALTVYQCNYSKVKKYSPKIYEYCQYCNFIEKHFFSLSDNSKYFLVRDFIEYTMMLSKKYPDSPDLHNIIANLSIIDYKIPISLDEKKVLKKFGLEPQSYILVNRACDGLQPNHPKLWSLNNYNELTKLLKENFDYALVQIGQNEFYGTIEHIDLTLLGKTSFEELKVLLKNALILICGEGGLVHLSHCLGGKSLVLFGPTEVAHLSYEDNINIQGNGCPFKCFELGNSSWREKCILGYSHPKCMESITPKEVFAKISEFIHRNVPRGYK